ncbi:1-(5-phosphoribosyl)-5-[(5-phosphoribosylamino)methylideneamino]imidazole-4-carboxamide isomerase [Psychroflexus montanilacus]|uniref:1-(5-phosphoribosyl)-5-[(5- phosphoribosylamino)methylideneamino]imidazole-4- carboxamide isomerase n=1 Tax=Psychroflexus montanilacus TaxID=2873598 RepID=UPI001CCAED73|nr:1-(5-phosphoribosyl)-5-[(5-phosphoribosylamino)methylideneamino]imidazole-4-carboxamide isomerase [Psychroflexus montanilacus]MBZ9650533.1 1-(5-phosphoribosyl)-5-[(5-phosphoribosylamino)methylideneamino]imidazole-4-carboxamide isomerase [Psychroflexus montanilacus]
MRIIPAIDIIEGQCVRLSKGDYETKKVYNENPLEVAKAFEDSGIEYLHLVDLDGAKSKHIVNHKILENIATQTNLKIDFGGGLKSDKDLKIAFECGAKQITGGSVAVTDKSLFLDWVTKFGADKIILGADAKNGMIATGGWKESSDLQIENFIRDFVKDGIQYVISTDISKDGMLEGPSVDLYTSILKNNPKLNLIASGGISSLQDVEDVFEIGCEGVIIGKAIYENRISLKELERFVLEH